MRGLQAPVSPHMPHKASRNKKNYCTTHQAALNPTLSKLMVDYLELINSMSVFSLVTLAIMESVATGCPSYDSGHKKQLSIPKRLVTPGLMMSDSLCKSLQLKCFNKIVKSPDFTVQSLCSCVSEPPVSPFSLSSSHTHCVNLKYVQVREGLVILPPHPLEQYWIVDTVAMCVSGSGNSAVQKLLIGQSIDNCAGSVAASNQEPLLQKSRVCSQKRHRDAGVCKKKKTFSFFFYSGRDQQHPLRFYMQYINKSNTFQSHLQKSRLRQQVTSRVMLLTLTFDLMEWT